ncbi:MAG: hypothetical protein NUW09_01905 [Deltaproteobacteria bacterium]|nr:hypothetical protein [Deltaproteobacteria bacterium]
MSYYSTISAFDFHSRLTEAELKDAFDRFVQNLTGEDRDCMGIYEFSSTCGIEKDGLYEYALEMGDYLAKHYADRRLAEFVSTVIAGGEYALVEFDGEDGEKWGYLVLSNEVHDFSYETLVNGKPLHEFIDEKTGGKVSLLEKTNKQETK